jgi:pyridoxal 5'-phosphate synthase pdxT subunit
VRPSLLAYFALVQGGQALLAGMDIRVSRNYFGSQTASFEAPVRVTDKYLDALGLTLEKNKLPGVFIRAPAVLEVGEGVDVVATVRASHRSDHHADDVVESPKDVIVAAVQQPNRMVTAFHPELTPSTNWHEFFLRMVEDYARTAASS